MALAGFHAARRCGVFYGNELARLCDVLGGAVFLGRDTQLVDDGVTSAGGRTQANVFRGARVSRLDEHDFCSAV